jgi:hypothetical protein
MAETSTLLARPPRPLADPTTSAAPAELLYWLTISSTRPLMVSRPYSHLLPTEEGSTTPLVYDQTPFARPLIWVNGPLTNAHWGKNAIVFPLPRQMNWGGNNHHQLLQWQQAQHGSIFICTLVLMLLLLTLHGLPILRPPCGILQLQSPRGNTSNTNGQSPTLQGI